MSRYSKALALALLLACPSLAAAQTILQVSAQCTGTNVQVSWSLGEGSHPGGYPNWTGFDVQRRSVDDCDAFVTVNPQPFPRVATNEYFEAPPIGKMYEYRVVFVDENRQIVSIPDCFDCQRFGYATCPSFSAPMTQGTLIDAGWALFVQPCAGGCFGSFYISDASLVQTLRPFAGTNTAFRFFGTAGCGTVEGCSLTVDHYDMVPCGVTPTRRSSWGELKTLYR